MGFVFWIFNLRFTGVILGYLDAHLCPVEWLARDGAHPLQSNE